MNHLIDILLPTYNPNHEHLAEAVESLMNQTEKNWKLFINDDHHALSQTQKMIMPFLKDPRINIQQSTKRLGIGGNWNTCLYHAFHSDAPFIAFLFQDDVWNEDYLEKGIQILQSDASIGMVALKHAYHHEGTMQKNEVYESIETWKNNGTIQGKQNGKDLLKQWIESELKPNIIGEPSFVILRKSVIQRAGFFREDLPQCLDSEMWMRILEHSNCYFLEDKEYGFFRVHKNAASAQNEESGAGRIDRLLCMDVLLKRGSIERKFLEKKYVDVIVSLLHQYQKRQKESSEKKSIKKPWKALTILGKHPIITLKALWKIRRLSVAEKQKNR
jgi:GT2 family glycosyltransferase